MHVALTIEYIALQLFITDTKRWLEVKGQSMFKVSPCILTASASSVVTDTLRGSKCNSSMIGASKVSPYLVINIALWVCVCVCVCVCVVDRHDISFLYS